MRYSELKFEGYIFRLKSKNLEEVELLFKANFSSAWTIELISEPLLMYYAFPNSPIEMEIQNVWDFYHAFSGLGNIEYVENNFESRNKELLCGETVKSDLCNPMVGSTKNNFTWVFDNINLPKPTLVAKEKNAQGEGIIIAITDTGYTKHKMIINNPNLLVQKGWNFLEMNNSALDLENGIIKNPGHGTSCMSLMIGSGTDSEGETIYGLAPNAQVIPIRMTTNVVNAGRVPWLRAIDYAVYRKALITSTSLRLDIGTLPTPVLNDDIKAVEDMLQYGIKNGLISFAAGGQFYGATFGIFPAASRYAISCTGNNIDNKSWTHSFKAVYHDIAAPAQEVYVASIDVHTYADVQRSCGTSFSTAIMAAVGAIWYSHWSPSYLHNIYGKENIFYLFRFLMHKYAIKKGVTGWDTQNYGPGIINVDGLIKMDGKPLPSKAEIEEYKKGITGKAKLGEYEKMNVLFPAHSETEVAKGFEQLFNKKQVSSLAYQELRFHLGMNPNLMNLVAHTLSNPAQIQTNKLNMLNELKTYASKQLINLLN